MAMPKSFTLQFTGIANVLITEIFVAEAFDHKQFLSNNTKLPPHNKFRAIWDTGATNTVITQKIIDGCGLKPIGMTMVHGVNSTKMSEVFLVNIVLPNQVGFSQIRVTAAELAGDVEALIGMDIIARGDFAVTNKEGKTTFSFRCPSTECIDFVKQSAKTQPFTALKTIGRNDPCSCGSGLKFKKCHGK